MKHKCNGISYVRDSTHRKLQKDFDQLENTYDLIVDESAELVSKYEAQSENLNRLSKDYNTLVIENREVKEESTERKSIIQKLTSELQASTDKCSELEKDYKQIDESLQSLRLVKGTQDLQIESLRTSGLIKLIASVILGLSFLTTLIIHLFEKYF